MKKKLVSVIVTLSMVFALVPAMSTSVFATEAISPIDEGHSIANCQVETGNMEFSFGDEILPELTVTDGDYILDQSEYVCQYYTDADYTSECIPDAPGTYYLRVMGADEYTDFIDVENPITID